MAFLVRGQRALRPESVPIGFWRTGRGCVLNH